MDALELLTADHNRVRGLFSRFQAAAGSNDGEAARLAETIFEELEVHTKVEEQIFYPAVSACNDELHELVTEAMEELNRLAREQEIPGRSSMNREKLLATVAPHS